MIIPDVIICAFTCELYLKAILCKEDIKFEHIHRLNKLFYLLDEDTQKFIEEETLTEYIFLFLFSLVCTFYDIRQIPVCSYSLKLLQILSETDKK